ncbi:MAG: Zn-ribbon domain-containing OB-fold protein [Sphingomonadales bacterium]|nr:MAG: Zn-ribbon domain-containing OB-fold protein [Sphingomonadales bacterium]
MMMDTSFPAPTPTINPETAPFWEATKRGVLLLPKCQTCQRTIWYPKTFCSACGTVGVDWYEASGRATIYSYTIMHAKRAAGPYADVVPYVIAVVELEEGPRLMTNIVDADPESLAIGQPVAVVFHPTENGVALPRFRPL